MSKAHNRSSLQLTNQAISTDNNTTGLWHFDGNLYSTQGMTPTGTPVVTHRTDGKFGRAIAIEEATTNIIPNQPANSYPTVGNTHGTYNTNQYNNNTYFSIGTINDVTNNVVTLSAVGRPIYTYDVLRPQTTGGGVTAGTSYFIKKISDTSFTLHQYDSSQDGSKGYRVHSSIYNDIRIPINSTDFPTMWHGAAHQPNSALVKEIIPNGFNGLHDCIRCHGEHKPEGEQDYMAYGVLPQVTSGTTYTISFWCRAATAASIGKNIALTLWTSADWTLTKLSGNNTFENMEWRRIIYRGVAPNTGGANLYFPMSKCATIDIAEIQFEAKSYATSFVAGSRSAGVLTLDNTGEKLVSLMNGGTISFWYKFNTFYDYGAIFRLRQTPYAAELYFTASKSVSWRPFSNAQSLTYTTTKNVGDWAFLTLTWDSSGNCSFYEDGVLKISGQRTTDRTGVYDSTIHIGSGDGVLYWCNGLIDELRFDNVVRTQQEIVTWYLSQAPFYDPLDSISIAE